MAERMTVDEARAKIDAAWREWLDALNSVSESRWGDPVGGGEWSIKDLIGHVAVWDDIAVQKLVRATKGADEAGASPAKTWQAINDESAAARKDRTVEQQRDEMQQNHANLLHMLSAMDEVDADALAQDTWDHYPEHTEQVRALK